MIITISNQKGGVGKTTTALNLGAGLNREGYKTLIVDLDSQADSTIGLGIGEAEFTIDDVINGKSPNKAILTLDNGLDIIPATKDLKATQISLEKPDILLKALNKIKDRYDYIIIDTNPGMSILTVNALLTSDYILIPTQPEFYALRGLRDFIETIDQLNNKFDITPAKIKILITNFDKRKILHREAKELIEENFKKDQLFKTYIRTNVALAEAPGQNKKNIYEYSPKSHGATDYEKLTKEVIKECN